MRSRGYVKSDSYPKFFRTASKNNYIREKSNYWRQNSNARSISKPGFNRRPNINGRPVSGDRPGGNNIRSGSKSFERPKGEVFKKIEIIGRSLKKPRLEVKKCSRKSL